jgi:hypothetical protein
MQIAVRFRSDLPLPLRPVLYFPGKGLSFGSVARVKFPSGDLLVIKFDPEPFDMVEKIISVMNDRYPDKKFFSFARACRKFDLGPGFIGPGGLPTEKKQGQRTST